MTRAGPSIRVLVTLALVGALLLIANPASADPGTGTALETMLGPDGPLAEITPQCDWWELWC